jgi:TonB-linked SusC/RagA family outer membrane protein
MRYTSGLTAVLLAGILTATAAAQERPISGTVRDSVNNDPLEYVVVSVVGSRITTVTRPNGTFVIPNAPGGSVTLLFRGIGFRSKELLVGGGESTVEVRLTRDVFRLEEVVVTGQATGVLRRNLANAIATVNASDLGSVPTASVEQQLQGKVAGADIQTNSGAPGGGVQVRLRGVTSLNADAQPLYVVDGVIMSDIAIPSNQNEVTNAAGGSNPALTQDGQVNRVADLNPNDIATIEILKGASASAIYGGRASNGVVIITTRRGRAGAPHVTLSQRFGFFELSHEIGSRHFTSAADVDNTYGPGTAAANGITGAVPFFDLERQLSGRRSLSFETSGSVSGGTENTRYFASALAKNDQGIIANTGFQRQAFRVNLDQRFSQRLNVSLSTDVLHTRAERGLTNNDNAGVSYYVALAFTPSFTNLTRDPATGLFRTNPFIGSNPLQTAALSRNVEDVWRFITGSRLTWDIAQSATSHLQFINNVGVDYFNQVNDLLFPPELQFEPQDGLPGTSLLSNSGNYNINWDVNLVHTWAPAGRGFTATTSAGIQSARRHLTISRITSRNLVAGQANVDAGTSVRVREHRERVNNVGFYAQEELLTMRDRLLLTLGARADQSSLNADPGKLFYYPKASISYRLERPRSFVDEVKLRLAYGQSGNEPLYGQRFTPLDATGNTGGLPGLQVVGTTAAPDLHPERQREIETGVDATLFGNRAQIEFTVFQKNISDLLLQRSLAPSSGFGIEVFNGGRMRTRGVELSLGLVPAQSQNFQWFMRTTFSANRSTITELPVPAFLNTGGGFGTSIGAFREEQGASATQIVGNDTLPDGSITVVKIGDANPSFRMAFNNSFSYGHWDLSFLLDWQHGSNILNLTKLLYDFGQVTEDYANACGPPACTAGETVGSHRLAGFTRVARNYMESASFLKLREISLTYELPPSIAHSLWGGVQSARLSVSGRNLFTITPYSGLDPEVSNFGNQAIARNIDVTPFPASRSFWFSIDLGF